MPQRVMPRKITNSFYYIKDSVKLIQCVDLVAESEEARCSDKSFTSCDVSKFLKDLKKIRKR